MTRIDWNAPIEAESGVPLVLAQHGMAFGDNTNPDADGDYWVLREGEVETGGNTSCAGGGWVAQFGYIRNREGRRLPDKEAVVSRCYDHEGNLVETFTRIVQPNPPDDARTIIRDLIADNGDRAAFVEACERARAFLGEG